MKEALFRCGNSVSCRCRWRAPWVHILRVPLTFGIDSDIGPCSDSGIDPLQGGRKRMLKCVSLSVASWRARNPNVPKTLGV